MIEMFRISDGDNVCCCFYSMEGITVHILVSRKMHFIHRKYIILSNQDFFLNAKLKRRQSVIPSILNKSQSLINLWSDIYIFVVHFVWYLKYIGVSYVFKQDFSDNLYQNIVALLKFIATARIQETCSSSSRGQMLSALSNRRSLTYWGR